MKPNLKITVVASLLFMSTVTFAQTAKETSKEINTAPVTTSDIVSKITGDKAKSDLKCPCDETTKKPPAVVKKKVTHKKHVKKSKKPVTVSAPREINMTSQNNIVEEPKPAPIEFYSYSDLKIVPTLVPFEQKNKWGSSTITPKLIINAVDMQGTPYPVTNFVQKDGYNLTLIQMNSDLSKAGETDLSTDTIFDPQFVKNNCQAFFVKYQLKGNSAFKISNFFLNNEGAIEYSLPPTCKVTTKDERDSSEYSDKGVISNISFTKITSVHNEKFEFILHLVKNGKDYFGQNIKGYVVRSDFKDIYIPEIIPHRKGPYFGTTFVTVPPTPGFYNVVIPFNIDDQKQIVTVSRTVR